MALGPLGKDDLRMEQRLTDRAHYLGDAGRTGKAFQGPEADRDRPSFQKTLKKKLGLTEESEKTEEGEHSEAPESNDPNDPRHRKEKEEALDQDEVRGQTRDRGQEQAQKLHGGHWRPPDPVAGMGAIWAGVPVLAEAVRASEGARGEGMAQETQEVGASQARVDASLLGGLREAGLKEPITGLDDPRLAGAKPALPGWQSGPVPGGMTYIWETAGRAAYQKLDWTDTGTRLESAAGSLLQTLERQGGQLFAQLRHRTPPEGGSFLVPDDPA